MADMTPPAGWTHINAHELYSSLEMWHFENPNPALRSERALVFEVGEHGAWMTGQGYVPWDGIKWLHYRITRANALAQPMRDVTLGPVEDPQPDAACDREVSRD